jgi:hypothetical protein
VKRIGRYLPLFFLLPFCIQFAEAQSRFDLSIGFGAIQDSATGNGIEGDYSGPNAANFSGTCTVGAADPTCAKTPSLSGFYMGIGGQLTNILWKHFGVGASVAFQPGKETYGTFPSTAYQLAYQDQIRTTFYSFDLIYSPVTTKKYAIDLLAGPGGANVKFYQNQTVSGTLIGSNNASQYFGSSNHFQVHAGVGVEIFVTDHIFVRPQFDLHYVPNFVQFGRNVVTSELVSLGYSFGDR